MTEIGPPDPAESSLPTPHGQCCSGGGGGLSRPGPAPGGPSPSLGQGAVEKAQAWVWETVQGASFTICDSFVFSNTQK